MRITIDLQACQTEGSRNRGVGRYSESLARTIAAIAAPDDDVHLCLSRAYADAESALRRELAFGIPARTQRSSYGYPPLRRVQAAERTPRVQLAEEIVRRHWLATQPDVLHVSHLGEGYSGEAVVPQPLPSREGLVRSATLYDLIPLRFPGAYLSDENFARWYRRQLVVLRQCDLLLAISESSRRDAIELLGIHPDAIATIWGGVEPQFAPGEVAPDRNGELRARFGIGRRFVLFTGGDDHRKNLAGAIAAYACLPPERRASTQLLIVCAITPARIEHYREIARREALSETDVLFAGYVEERDLVDLYRICDAFIFPSLYEGFGLPVLEAMSCGAATLGGDNSSIRELIGRPDALFDAGRPDDAARALEAVLSNEAHAADLRRYGAARAREFTWERSARAALEAMAAAVERHRPADAWRAAARLPRRRLAVFTPLPPARSGIADHSALLLPALSRHFDVEVFVDDGASCHDAWIRDNLPVHRHETFETERRRFDAVLYEMGNSEFHEYMLPYLARFPGVVTLHDAYLSGLFGFLEFYRGERGRFFDEMLHSHGPNARRLLAPSRGVPDAAFQAMVQLPCTKRVLDQSLGIVSHSPFNRAVSRGSYPQGWRAPFRVINQMVRAGRSRSAADRNAIRARLGIAPDDFVIATFGHVAWTKYGDTLLEGFRASTASTDPRLRLIFVGELALDDFGKALQADLESGALAGQVAVTGFLDEAAFSDYLACTDLAFQLRKSSRGGAPKGVLDCMAAGVPVVVNDEASYRDYDDGIIVKLPGLVMAAHVAETIDAAASNPARFRRIAANALAYVESEHHPELGAACYALLIDECIARNRATRISDWVGSLAKIERLDVDAPDSIAIADEIARQASLEATVRQRILVDVTHLASADHGTGIPRVVRAMTQGMYFSSRPGFDVVAVRLTESGTLCRAGELLRSFGVLAGSEDETEEAIELVPDDFLLMLDSSWARWPEFEGIHRRLRSIGGRVATAVFDLLPIRLPDFMVPGGPAWFRSWLDRALEASDAVVCISRAVADDLHEYVRTEHPGRFSGLRIGYWHLGADFASPPAAQHQGARSGAPSFLMVGTIEPRKRHALALEAFELLWERGSDAQLVIFGRPGWMVDSLMERLSTHPERGGRLRLHLGASDFDLDEAYRSSTALLFPSAGEGFGLPLIEAAHRGLPILASDIPVFREIAGDAATYVPCTDPQVLAASIETWIGAHSLGRTPASSGLAYLSWQQSAEQLLDLLLDNRWYRRV